MSLGVRIFLGFCLLSLVGSYIFLDQVLQQIKPGLRLAVEETLVDAANLLAELATDEFNSATLDNGRFLAALQAANQRQLQAKIGPLDKTALSQRLYITNAQGIVVLDSSGLALGQDYSRWNDVYLTLRGQYGARSTRRDPRDERSSVMHVAAPLYRQGQIVGALTLTKPNLSVQLFLDRARAEMLRSGLWLLCLALALGLLLSLWFTRVVGRLVKYARAVSAGQRVALPCLPSGELRTLGQALEHMRTELEGRESVEQYVYALTHELKSPLTAIQSAVELLRDELPPADREHFLNHIQQQAQRLHQLSVRLLDLAALEKREALHEVRSVDLCQVLEHVVASRQAQMAQRQITLHYPERLVYAPLQGERLLLEQAIGNLLDNALEFSDPQHGAITLSVLPISAGWQVQVQDNGSGIPEYALARIGERFYSLPRHDGSKGHGLGLAFVHQVAQLHGGRLQLSNAPQSGVLAQLELAQHPPSV